MRHALWTLVVVMLISAASQAVAQNWTEHRPEGGGYVVEMPGEPKVSWQDVPTKLGEIKTYIATSELGPIAFITMYSRYPETYMKGQSAASILEGGRNGAVANVKGKLRTETTVTISNSPGRELLIDTPSGLVMMMRYFLRSNTLIQAIVGGPAGVETNADTRRFLDSLRTIATK
jgi:hypothetical protein